MRLEPAPADVADLQPIAAQDSADAQFDVKKLALQKLAADQKRPGVLAIYGFRVHRTVPAHS